MAKSLYILAPVIIAFLLFSCAEKSSNPDDNTYKRALNQSEKTLSNSTTVFGANLFKTVNERENPDNNIFISPLSASMALGMVYNGSDGDTKIALEEALEYNGLSTEEINNAYKSLMELFVSLDNDVTFNIANSIWYPPDLNPLEEFVNVNKTYFDAEVNSIDFANPDSKDIINGWVEDKTKGKIKDIIDRIPEEAVMFLVNAIYFKAAWTYEFDTEKTFDAKFTTYRGLQADCRMMRQTSGFNYYECGDFQAIDLPYGNGDYSMTIFLPATSYNINDMISQMADKDWQGWNANFEKTELTLYMPKFRLECKYILNEALKAMGMDIAFDYLRADFTKIFGGDGFYIGRVIHKTFVEVNEEGTEAAAATVVEVNGGSAGGTVMNLNRPFVFIIREHASGTFMFMGKLCDPS